MAYQYPTVTELPRRLHASGIRQDPFIYEESTMPVRGGEPDNVLPFRPRPKDLIPEPRSPVAHIAVTGLGSAVLAGATA